MLLMKTEISSKTDAASSVRITPSKVEAGANLRVRFTIADGQRCNDFQLMIDGAQALIYLGEDTDGNATKCSHKISAPTKVRDF